MSIFLICITISIIHTMWSSLEEIDEVHFPMIERSAINVRLVNLINYQFKLAAKNRNLQVVQDLKINVLSLEQNYKSMQRVEDIIPVESRTLFKNGNEIITLFSKSEWDKANHFIIKTNFSKQLEDFSFDIFDSTEALADERDKNGQNILNSINKTIFISSITIIFILFLIRNIYIGYIDNLKERLVAEDKANLLSKQRETLIHVLCHDLGNPISAIYSLTEIEHMLDEDARSNLISTIKSSAKESLDIINLTRKMQALETGKFKMELTSVCFSTCINKSLTTLKEKIKSKELHIQETFDKTLTLQAEETTLVNSILNNVLTNSIKFSNHGGIIQISSQSNELQTKVIIQDHGIGIPKDLLANLFSETEQTSRLGTDGEIGTGFGMPLVKKFMNSYGGEIEVSSSTEGVNIGTITTLIFPKVIT